MKKILLFTLMVAALLSGCSGNREAQTSKASPETNQSTAQTRNDKKESSPTSETGTRKNPLKMGETVTWDGLGNSYYNFKIELTLLEVVRGQDALDMALAGNQFNSEPPEGKEYIFAKFKVHALESKDDEKVDVNNALFTFVSKDGVEYGDFVVVTGLPSEFTPIYAGAETIGYAVGIIDIDDKPSILFRDEIWFALQ